MGPDLLLRAATSIEQANHRAETSVQAHSGDRRLAFAVLAGHDAAEDVIAAFGRKVLLVVLPLIR